MTSLHCIEFTEQERKSNKENESTALSIYVELLLSLEIF